MNILDRILPWRRRIRGLIALNKTLNADCQEWADRLENLRFAYRDLVGNASLDRAAIPFYEKRIGELEDTLRDLVKTTDFRHRFWHEYGEYPDLVPVAKERRELLARIEKVLQPTKKD